MTTIESYAFDGCRGLESITLPTGLTTINNHVFRNTSLTSITIPNGVQSIGNYAFDYCLKLTSVTIPGTVKTIGESAFNYCKKLESIGIPNGVTTIGGSAFSDCTNLTSISIPKSVTSIGILALARTTSLSTIVVESGNAKYDSRDNCNAIIETATNALAFGCKNTVIPNTVTTISSGAFQGCTTLTSIVIPESVTAIDDYAFVGTTGLVAVTVKSAVPLTISATFPNRKNATLYVPVGSKAAYEAATGWKDFKEIVEGEAPSPNIIFADANVKELCVTNWDTNGDGELSEAEAAAVTDLGGVFSKNTAITSFDELQFFTGLTNIGNEAFLNCVQLSSVIIPSGVTSIGAVAFSYCKALASISIPNSVSSIGCESFSYCSKLSSLTIPRSVTAMDNTSFIGCNSVESIIVEAGNTVYDSRDNCNAIIVKATNSLFFGCRNTIIPNNVTSIGQNAFYDNDNITSIDIPSSVTAIGSTAFCGCTNLSSIIIPKSVTSIGAWGFNGCNLISVTVKNSIPVKIDSYCFSNRANATLHVPFGSKAAYEAADYWKEFKEIVEKESEVLANEIWAGSQEIKDWNSLTIDRENLTSLNIGDVLHVEVTDVAESEAYAALFDGTWTQIAPWYGLSPDKTEAVFNLTGDMVRELKTYGMVLTCNGYTIKRIYTTPAYTGSENSIWLGNQTDGDISVDNSHFIIANRKTGVKAGDIIRLAYTGSGTPNISYFGEDSEWTWKTFNDAVLTTTETGADVTVTGAMATLLNRNNLIVQLGDAGLTLTQVELISGAQTVLYQVAEGDAFASGTQKELENITLTYGEAGGEDFKTPIGWLPCEAEGIEFPYYSPGNGVNGNKAGGTFYVFKPKKNGLLTVVVRQNSAKPFYVEENGSVMNDFNGVTKGEDGTYQGTYKIEVKANRIYKMYCSGSKLGFFGFIYDWRDNADLINIEFADANVKALCVANWDTNKDGELSEAEAAAVTDIGDVFKENTEITSFDEFRYFSGMTELPSWRAFEGCSALKSIIIPAGVTSIDGGAFANCPALEKISVEAMNGIYESPANCNAIVEKSTNKLVVGCNTTTIPNTVTTIGDASFWGRFGMTSMDIPESVTVIEPYAFTWCANLSSVSIPASVTTIGSNAFCYTGLISVTLPATLTDIGDEAFNGCSNLTTVIVENPTPVAITEEVFSNRANATLYVPEKSVAAYRAADYWKEFKDIKIIGFTDVDITDISQLSDAIYADAATASKGGTGTLSISLKNAQSASGYSFDLTLPDGVTLAKDESGDYDFTIGSRLSASPTIEYNETTNTYGFGTFSVNNFKDNDGVILKLKLKVSDNVEPNNYPVKIGNGKYSLELGATSVAMPETISQLTVTNYLKGDANGDGAVDIADAVCIVNRVVGKITPFFVEAAADANGDGEVDIADAVRIVNLVVGKIPALAPRFDFTLPEPE